MGDDPAAESVMASFAWDKMPTAADAQRSGLDTPMIRFTGSLSAKISFVLDFAAVAAEEDTPGDTEVATENPEDDPGDQEGPDVPWVLRGCGFDETNVLLWTFNFKRFSALTAKDLARSPSGNLDLSESHRAIIAASQARILITCGPRAERAICASTQSTKAYIIEVRGMRYTMRVLQGYGNTRLCIHCPELPSRSWSCSPAHMIQLSEAIKLAARLTNTEGVRPYTSPKALVFSAGF